MSSRGTPPDKICATCGRPFAWRRKWAAVWDDVRYCSDRCRRGVGEPDRRIEQAIVELLAARAATATCCPSEAARLVFGEGDEANPRWRREMERVRRAGRRLAHAGVVVWTAGGRVVDPGTVRGPVRFARGPAFRSPAPGPRD